MSDQLTPEQVAEAEAAAAAEAQAKAEQEAADAAQAEAAKAALAADKEMVDIVTTAPGTFGLEGIAQVGTKRTVHYTAFADTWMKPANLMSQQRLKALQKRDGAKNGA